MYLKRHSLISLVSLTFILAIVPLEEICYNLGETAFISGVKKLLIYFCKSCWFNLLEHMPQFLLPLNCH